MLSYKRRLSLLLNYACEYLPTTSLIFSHVNWIQGFPGDSVVKNPVARGSIPGYGRSLRKKEQPTAVFLPGEFHGQKSLTGYSRSGSTRDGQDSATKSNNKLDM